MRQRAGRGGGPGVIRCSEASRAADEPLAGTAPQADVWVVVEHPEGWGDAPLARAEHGVRVLMARGPRTREPGFRRWGPPPGPGRSVPARGRGVDGVDGAATTQIRVWVAHCGPDPTLRTGRVDDPEEVGGWDLAGIAAGTYRTWGHHDPRPLLLVCANGRRDRCCGHDGGRLADALWDGPLGVRVLTCTHLGGHRFAPTGLLLPFGALHGRLDEHSACALLDWAAAGRMPGATLRGFSVHEEPAQVAEAHVRQQLGLTGLAPLDVELTGDPANGRLVAAVRPAGPDEASGPHMVTLVQSARTAQLSCGRAVEPHVRWEIASL